MKPGPGADGHWVQDTGTRAKEDSMAIPADGFEFRSGRLTSLDPRTDWEREEKLLYPWARPKTEPPQDRGLNGQVPDVARTGAWE